MYYVDHNIDDLEQQLHGFDAALAAAGILGDRPTFNQAFTHYAAQRMGLSGSQGWARMLLHQFGRTARTEEALWQLVSDFLSQ